MLTLERNIIVWGNTEQGLPVYICNIVTINQQFHYFITFNSKKNGGEEHACLKSSVYIQIHFDWITNYSYLQVCSGMGSAISNVHKEIYKAARHCLTDRVMAVRSAAAKVCLFAFHCTCYAS